MQDCHSTSRPDHAARPVLTLGWREWVALPELDVPAIKAKLDTGARTSALHTFRIEPFTRNDCEWVRFWLHPLRRNLRVVRCCEAPVLDRRIVRDSGGHEEQRFVIATQVCVASHEWNIEITLTDRENMLFRMLLGRTAMIAGGISVDPSASYVYGRTAGHSYRSRTGG